LINALIADSYKLVISTGMNCGARELPERDLQDRHSSLWPTEQGVLPATSRL